MKASEAGGHMYNLGVRREFIARHFLIGGDWGPENQPNSHHYVLELRLSGSELDQHGYLVDIMQVEKALDDLIARFSEHMLNELPEFKGLNPSLEHFARITALALSQEIPAPNITTVQTVLWENPSAWASFAVERQPAS
jgi:6-pyruvoyltetrahydropterin/6-carboxytetrahydropterin synthase